MSNPVLRLMIVSCLLISIPAFAVAPSNPNGMMLAGKVAKGCIACHSAAPGGDMMFLHD